MTASIGRYSLPDFEREQIITLLVIWTGYAESAFIKMDDRELMTEYRKRLGEDLAWE